MKIVYPNQHCVYGILCQSKFDGRFSVYIGATEDFWKRYEAHKRGSGCRFTRSRKVLFGAKLIAGLPSKEEAHRMEKQVKKWSSEKKLRTLQDLYFESAFGKWELKKA